MTALRRTSVALRRSEAVKARTDTRAWVMDRRARTRRLIELGGLVALSGLEETIVAAEPDTRAVILGALLQLAEELRGASPSIPSPLARMTTWRARGRFALRAERADLYANFAVAEGIPNLMLDRSPEPDRDR